MFATNFTLDLIYDEDVIKRLQIKKILGFGIIVKLKKINMLITQKF